MRIEEGKFYRTCGGQRVGPIKRYQGTDHFHLGFGDSDLWKPDGTGVGNADLVAELPTDTAKPERPVSDYDWDARDEAPKLWRDMTPEEKGAFWVKVYRGGAVEYSRDAIEWHPDYTFEPDFHGDLYYRIRPEPKRETVTVTGGLGSAWGFYEYGTSPSETHSITFDMIDGDLPPGTYTHPDGHTITVERIE
jgi:hypothetical protein